MSGFEKVEFLGRVLSEVAADENSVHPSLPT